MAKVQNISTKSDDVIGELPLACASEAAAVDFMEKQRWEGKPYCPTCGDISVYQMKDSKTGARQANYRWRCNGCKDQFTVRKGTVLEDSRIPLRHWCFAFWRAATSKKGVSALEIHRQTGLSYKSSLFLLNRIRHAMHDDTPTPLSGTVEVDEVFIGGKPRKGQGGKVRGKREKTPVVGMLERGGRVRTAPITKVSGDTLREAMKKHIDFSNSTLMTDEYIGYRAIGREFKRGHQTVNHSKDEYVRGDASQEAEQLPTTDVWANHAAAFWPAPKRLIDPFRQPRVNPLTEAISKVLADADRPLATKEIYETLVARNVSIPGKNPKNNLSAHLSTNKQFIRTSEGQWALRAHDGVSDLIGEENDSSA